MDLLDKIVNELLPRFEGMESYFTNKDEDSFAAFCHSQLSGGIGMQIRNEYKLWPEDSENHIYFKKTFGLNHADDMSNLILRKVYQKKRSQLNQNKTMENEATAKTPTKTKGEYRVGIDFNPGGHATVNSIKRKAADLIDEIELIAAETKNGEVKRLCATAQTEIESAAMWAVKAATKPDWA